MKCPKCDLPMLKETLTGGKCACDYVYGKDLYTQVAEAWQSRAEKSEASLSALRSKVEALSVEKIGELIDNVHDENTCYTPHQFHELVAKAIKTELTGEDK